MNIQQINNTLAKLKPAQIIRWGVTKFGMRQVMTTSFGIESALMIHLALGVKPDMPVIFINTGFLFEDTLDFGLELAGRFRINLKRYKPRLSPEQIEKKHGKLWEKQDKASLDLYDEITKTEPLRRALRELNAASVVSGVRRYQTKERQSSQIAEGGYYENTLKLHPILDWTEEQVGYYFEQHDLPYHPFKEKGYGSVGDRWSTVPGIGRESRWPGLDKDQCSLLRPGEGI